MNRVLRAWGATSWLWGLAAAAMLAVTAVFLIRTVASYKLIYLGEGESAIGLSAAAFAILPLFATMWLGRLSDQLASFRFAIAFGALVIGLGGACVAWASTAAAVIMASAILGIGQTTFAVCAQSAITRLAPSQRLDASFGSFTAALSLGQMFGPLLSGLLLGNASLSMSTVQAAAADSIAIALWVGVVISCAAAPVILFSKLDGRRQLGPGAQTAARGRGSKAARPDAKRGPGAKGPSILKILKVSGVPSQVAAAMALLSILDILTAFLPLVGEERGVSPFCIGILLAVRGGASFISRIFLPMLIKKWSRETLLLASLLGSAAAVALLPLVLDWFWLAVLLMSLGGCLLGLGQPMTMTMISQAVPAAWRGAALALRLMGNRVGQVVFPVVAGVVASPLGPSGALWFACAVMAGAGAQRLVQDRHGGTDL